MLDLIKEELLASSIDGGQVISLNFENMSNAHLCSAVALHDEIIRRASKINGKAYLFFDGIQGAGAWEKCITSFRIELYRTVCPDADSRQCFHRGWPCSPRS